MEPNGVVVHGRYTANCYKRSAWYVEDCPRPPTGRQRRGDGVRPRRLDRRAVDADDRPDLHRFTCGLRPDRDAARIRLTLPTAVEGVANRTKMIKRQMYGRANFDLLRKNVLIVT